MKEKDRRRGRRKEGLKNQFSGSVRLMFNTSEEIYFWTTVASIAILSYSYRYCVKQWIPANTSVILDFYDHIVQADRLVEENNSYLF